MERLLEILREMNPDIDYEKRTDLFTSGDLDSMNIILLASEISDEFDIDIKAPDIIPENFDSAEAMMEMILRLQEQ